MAKKKNRPKEIEFLKSFLYLGFASYLLSESWHLVSRWHGKVKTVLEHIHLKYKINCP